MNALHFGRDPRGKQPFSLGGILVMLVTYLALQPYLHGLHTPSLWIVWDCPQAWVPDCPVRKKMHSIQCPVSKMPLSVRNGGRQL